MIATSNFPQADRLEQVGLVAEAIHNGHTGDSEIESYIGLNSEGRQGRYYRLSAEILGLIVNDQNRAKLTEVGAEYAKLSSSSAKIDYLARCIVETDVFKFALSYINKHEPTDEQLSVWFRKFYPGAESTANRRFSTFKRYLHDTKLVRNNNGKNVVVKFTGGIVKQPYSAYLDLKGRNSGTTPPPRVGANGSAVYNVDGQKRERANQIHWKLVDAKASYLSETGVESFEDIHIDLFARRGDETIFYEMKSINDSEDNTRSQIRKAVSQLYEYRYIYNEPKARLCVVTNSKLRGDNAWLADYLAKDRTIAYEWTDDFVNFECPKNSKTLLGDFSKG